MESVLQSKGNLTSTHAISTACKGSPRGSRQLVQGAALAQEGARSGSRAPDTENNVGTPPPRLVLEPILSHMSKISLLASLFFPSKQDTRLCVTQLAYQASCK